MNQYESGRIFREPSGLSFGFYGLMVSGLDVYDLGWFPEIGKDEIWFHSRCQGKKKDNPVALLLDLQFDIFTISYNHKN